MRVLVLLVASAAIAGCGSSTSSGGTFGGEPDASAAGGDAGADSGSGNVGIGDASFQHDGSSSDAGAPVGEVWAHSAGTLYKLEPFSKTTTRIGDFSGCAGQMIDIALDKDGQMYGTTFISLEKIDKATAKCTTIRSNGSYPNSLAFVPKGTLDPNVEVLVGFEQDQYVRIDLATGNKTTVGSLNPNSTGMTFVSSGDVVSIINDKTYLTVKATPDLGSDAIIEVDPVSGKALKLIGATGQADIFGLGYWAGTAYGFTNAGEIFAIDLTNGKSTSIPIPNPPAGLSFWGAGVTTAAPTNVPR